MTRIQTAAVLGAGNMGAQIAAHLANAGVPTWLLDVTPDAARAGLERARAMRPDPFFTSDTHTLIRTGGFEDLSVLGACDWVVEAIVEQLDIKQGLLERVEAHVGGETIVTSNTSGIPHRQHRRRPQRVVPQPLARHAFLQPSALSAAARSHPHGAHPSRRSRDHRALRRSTSRQRAWSSRRTRQDSSPTASGFME